MITSSGVETTVVERRLHQSRTRFFSSDDSVDWVEYFMIVGKQCWINASNESIDYAQRIAGAHLCENACYCCSELPIGHRELSTLSTVLLLLVDMEATRLLFFDDAPNLFANGHADIAISEFPCHDFAKCCHELQAKGLQRRHQSCCRSLAEVLLVL